MSVFLPLVAAAAGVAAHLLVFNRGEHHMYATRYLQALILTFATSVVALTHYGEQSVTESLKLSGSVVGYFLASLYSGLVIYRLFFNPLNKFPGPYFARLSMFDLVLRSTKFDTNKRLYEFHQKYGKSVRIGPNDLSITDPDGVQVISGATSKCRKASW